MSPRLSIVLLTWNEEQNILSCLNALARQRNLDFEVIVIDAASKDRTVELIRGVQPRLPFPLRLDVAKTRIPIGEARNLGVALAQAPQVAFLSADAEADEAWTEEALRTLETWDMAFGRQVHDPRRWTFAASVRGLRYHFPEKATPNPLRYASNVASAYYREILVDFPFEPAANAAEDIRLAQRAHAAGYTATYNPAMVVRHHDVWRAREEMHKNVREGYGWGLYQDELGVHRVLLSWGTALAILLTLAVLMPALGFLVLFVAVLWAPAVRRAILRRRVMSFPQLLKGVAASPAYDLAFLIHYLRGLVAAGRRSAKDLAQPKEAQT